MRQELEHRITVTGAASDTINITRDYTRVYITCGTVTLAGSYSFDVTGTPAAEGDTIWIECNLTGLTLSGNTCTILDKTIPQAVLTAGRFFVVGRMDSDKVRGTILINTANSSVIPTGSIIDSAITTVKINDNAVTYAKLQDFTGRGYLLRGGVAGAPEEFKANTTGAILIGDGTDVKSTAMTGDVTINGSGVTSISNGVVTTAMLAFTLTSYLETTVTLSSAQILAGYTTPVSIVAAPGSGKYIEVISATAYNNFNTTAYANGTDLLELQVGAKVWEFPNSFTEAVADQVCQGTRVDNAVISQNTALTVRTTSADPTTGDGTITLKVIYVIRTI